MKTLFTLFVALQLTLLVSSYYYTEDRYDPYEEQFYDNEYTRGKKKYCLGGSNYFIS